MKLLAKVQIISDRKGEGCQFVAVKVVNQNHLYCGETWAIPINLVGKAAVPAGRNVCVMSSDSWNITVIRKDRTVEVIRDSFGVWEGLPPEGAFRLKCRGSTLDSSSLWEEVA